MFADYIQETVIAPSILGVELTEENHHHYCVNCFYMRIVEYWLEGKNSNLDIIKALPEELLIPKLTTGPYDAVEVDGEVHVVYQGRTINVDDIECLIHMSLVKTEEERAEEAHARAENKAKRKRKGVEVRQFNSLAEVINYIMTRR